MKTNRSVVGVESTPSEQLRTMTVKTSVSVETATATCSMLPMVHRNNNYYLMFLGLLFAQQITLEMLEFTALVNITYIKINW